MRRQSNTTVILSLNHVMEYLDLLTLQPNETSIKYECDTWPKQSEINYLDLLRHSPTSDTFKQCLKTSEYS